MASPLQLVKGNGEFNANGLKEFVRSSKLENCGLRYAVVAIMGPQSSGKSTLLNHLFNTDFVEMNAAKGRRQTTQGVWLAKAVGMTPDTLVMDMEGSDGAERGEDDTKFERQSALYAIAVCDIVIINMWHHDLGRENPASRPLLKAIFEVMLRLLPERKTTLMFVIRDKSRKVPMEIVDSDLRQSLQMLWDMVPKPEEHKQSPLSAYFNVRVTSLPNYEDRREEFMEEVAELRKGFQNSTEKGGLAADRSCAVHITSFPFNIEKIWFKIAEEKDLDLPTHKIMVATYRCDQIAKEKLQSLSSDSTWQSLEQEAQNGIVEEFGKRTDAVVGKLLDEYSAESRNFDEKIRKTKQNSLTSDMWNRIQHAYSDQIKHRRDQAWETFQSKFDSCIETYHTEQDLTNLCRAALDSFHRECEDAKVPHMEWNAFEEVGSIRASKEAAGSIEESKKKLSEKLNAHVKEMRTAKLKEVTSAVKKRLENVLSEHTLAILA
ncbi:protein ROOT HAIR DEFECTIVE 3 homolog 2-like [Physcomitrium patens]|uniref:protein ROOT HAIR DEFECTIVE 3 homolog 2-like n=1 Tax=Physcomitrium patens TaxID=3218 RepID=UPI00024AD707